MALAVTASNLAWQRVSKALAASGTTTGPSSAAAGAFKALKEYLAGQGKNPDLQVFFYTEDQADAAA